MKENRIKKVVRDGGVAIGTVLGEFTTRGVAQMLEYTTLDWIVLDVQHGGFSVDTTADLLSWFKATPITVIVNPPRYMLPMVMEIGASAVQIDNVESAADAQAIVQVVMYPPCGSRAVTLNAAHTDFRRPPPAEYSQARNAQTSIVASIESLEGLNSIDEIAAVDGIDIIEPSRNLATALGVPHQYDDAAYHGALRRVSDACLRYGKMLKYHPLDSAEVANAYQLGCRVMGIRDAIAVFEDELGAEAASVRDLVGGLGAC